jgi:hypothetical protein
MVGVTPVIALIVHHDQRASSASSSPDFTTIRSRTPNQCQIHTVIIRSKVRPQFGPPHVNPRVNLAHCFCCGQNFNNIDLLIALGYDFLAAVEVLEPWLRQHRERRTARST